MRSYLSVVGLSLLIAAGPWGAGEAIAKPKAVSFGCTAQQIQSPQAGQCISQLQDDVLHNRPRVHELVCTSTGHMMCCEVDENNNIIDHSCDVIERISRPLFDLDNLTVKPMDNDTGPAVPSGATGFQHGAPPPASSGTP
ncbi:MAG TPA: hypothetical protein VHA07_00745 [Devosia sp.]|nr:hypothetical protein [Devosia sp.]